MSKSYIAVEVLAINGSVIEHTLRYCAPFENEEAAMEFAAKMNEKNKKRNDSARERGRPEYLWADQVCETPDFFLNGETDDYL